MPAAQTPGLVLLPGMDGTGELFEPLVAHVDGRLATTVVRYPGDRFLDYDALTALVTRSLPEDRPFVILGESFSGPVAVKLAAARPSGLRGIILGASFVSNPWPVMTPMLGLLDLTPIHFVARTFGVVQLTGRFGNGDLHQRLKASLAQVSASVLRARAREAATTDVTAELTAFDGPSLYLRASEDAVVPKSAADRFAAVARNGRVDTITGPHCLLQCAPAQCAQVIERFVATVAGGASPSVVSGAAGA
ncbi:MAG: alpha/beta hydrolase [Pseudomonadota bacterium]